MKVAKELKSPTLGNLSDTALYLITTLPEEEKQTKKTRQYRAHTKLLDSNKKYLLKREGMYKY